MAFSRYPYRRTIVVSLAVQVMVSEAIETYEVVSIGDVGRVVGVFEVVDLFPASLDLEPVRSQVRVS